MNTIGASVSFDQLTAREFIGQTVNFIYLSGQNIFTRGAAGAARGFFDFQIPDALVSNTRDEFAKIIRP